MAESDSQELEDLFTKVSLERAVAEPPDETCKDNAVEMSQDGLPSVVKQVGRVARSICDAMKEIGAYAAVHSATDLVPDVRSRLDYIAVKTSDAANKVLDAADKISPVKDKLRADGEILMLEWDKVLSGSSSVDDFKSLVLRTRSHLAETSVGMDAISNQVSEIIVAQDFQDLTGQVIKKTLEIIQNVEGQLVSVLMEHHPAPPSVNLLDGPVIDSSNRTDIVKSQEEVDLLLESMGF